MVMSLATRSYPQSRTGQTDRAGLSKGSEVTKADPLKVFFINNIIQIHADYIERAKTIVGCL